MSIKGFREYVWRKSITAKESPFCDFCDAHGVARSYDSDDFTICEMDDGTERADYVSQEGWAACLACAEFVDRKDWPGLVDRVAPIYAKRYGWDFQEEMRWRRNYLRLLQHLGKSIRPS